MSAPQSWIKSPVDPRSTGGVVKRAMIERLFRAIIGATLDSEDADVSERRGGLTLHRRLTTSGTPGLTVTTDGAGRYFVEPQTILGRMPKIAGHAINAPLVSGAYPSLAFAGARFLVAVIHVTATFDNNGYRPTGQVESGTDITLEWSVDASGARPVIAWGGELRDEYDAIDDPSIATAGQLVIPVAWIGADGTITQLTSVRPGGSFHLDLTTNNW